MRVTVIGMERKTDGSMILKTGNTLEIEGSDKPALIAESLALVVPKKASKSEAYQGPVATGSNMEEETMTETTQSWIEILKKFGSGPNLPKVDVDKLIPMHRKNL